mgnify:CR=1 FL=1
MIKVRGATLKERFGYAEMEILNLRTELANLRAYHNSVVCISAEEAVAVYLMLERTTEGSNVPFAGRHGVLERIHQKFQKEIEAARSTFYKPGEKI